MPTGERDICRIREFVRAGILLVVVVGGMVDLILDAPPSIWSLHVPSEIGLVVCSLACAVVLFRGWRRSVAALRRRGGPNSPRSSSTTSCCGRVARLSCDCVDDYGTTTVRTGA